MIELFLRRKPSKLLICLKDTEREWTLDLLAKESQMTYVYLMKLLPKLKTAELITDEKKGRKKVLKLTEKGLEIASLLEQLERKETAPVPEQTEKKENG